MSMTKRNWLCAHDVYTAHVIGTHPAIPNVRGPGNQKHRAENTRLGNNVETAMENLGHTSPQLHAFVSRAERAQRKHRAGVVSKEGSDLSQKVVSVNGRKTSPIRRESRRLTIRW